MSAEKSILDVLSYLQSNYGRLWCFLIFLISSLICSLFTLYHLIFDRNLRKLRNNHIIIIILLVGLVSQTTNYPWMIHFYRVDGVWSRSYEFCAIWAYIDWTFYLLRSMLLAWATIERHILIFIHYLPPVFLVSYFIIFYAVADTLAPCQNWYNTDWMKCVFFCISTDYKFWLWETIVHQVMPCCIIIIFTIALFVRVISTKMRARQPVQWQRQRKMATQLMSMILIYIIFFLPYSIYYFLTIFIQPLYIHSSIVLFLELLSYLTVLVIPFSCMLTLPELGKRLKAMLCCK